MKRIVILLGVMGTLAFQISFANPVPEKQVEFINAFPPEIGVMFYFPEDISGDTIYTTSGIAIVDLGVAGDENELVILDSSNTSGFILNPECDIIDLPEDWYNNAIRYGTLGYAPPPIRGHSIYLRPYCRGFDAWSFGFSRSCFGSSEIIINEVNAHCLWSPEANFIELYNSGDTAINLEGWRVVCDTMYDFPSGATIPHQGFYIIDEDGFPPGFDLDFSADNIYLISADSYLVDQVGWSSDHGQNVSFMRFPDGDADSTHPELGYMGYDDESSYTFENGFPSRGAPNRHQSPGFVVIGTRAIGGDVWVDLHWTNPIWDEEFNASRVLRSFDHFPETPDDGQVVYQGDGQYVQDVDIPPNQWVYYTVFARNDGGEYSIPTDESRASIILGRVGVTDDETLPRRISFLRCYPNPFNASVSISYGLAEDSDVAVEIYNIVGQRVTTLFEGIQQVGRHGITWDASGFPSGVYFARLEVGKHSQNIKMVLLK